MSQKVIRTILFIFFLFLFNLVIAEETKVKLVKVKEFSSYEEYEKWKGIERQKPKIRVEDDKVRFFDKDNKLLKEKFVDSIVFIDANGRYTGERITGWSKQRKLENGSKLERVYIMPNTNGVIIEKMIFNEKENIREGYYILNNNGDTIAEINDDVTLYASPDGKYFIGCGETGEGELYGDIKFYDRKGNMFASVKNPFGFEGMPYIMFSPDSKYIAISVHGRKKSKDDLNKDGLTVFDNKGNLLWKKIVEGANIYIKNFSLSGKLLVTQEIKWSRDFKSRECTLFVFTSKDGKIIFEYNLPEIVATVTFSPDESKMVWLGYTTDDLSKKRKGIVYITSTKNWEIISKIELPTQFRWLYDLNSIKILQPSDKYILINVGYETTMEDVYIMDYKGQILDRKRISYESIEIRPDIKFDGQELVITKKDKIELYKLDEQ